MSFGLLFTYLMTYGGSAVALFNPYVGLLIYVCFAIIKPEWLWHWAVPQGNYSRIIAASLLVGWAVRGFGDWRFGRAGLVVACLLGHLGWAAVSATQAAVSEIAWAWIETQAKIVLPFVVGITLVRSVRQLKQLAWVIVLSQGYVAYDFNLSYLGGFNRVQEIGFGGMDNNCVGITLVTCIGLAGFLGMGSDRLWKKGLALAAAACMGHAVLLTFSRGAMLGLIIVAGVAFLLTPKRPVHYAALLVGVLGMLVLAGPEVRQRFASSFAGEEQRDESAQSRVVLWGVCVRAAADHPVVGLGPDHFPVYAHTFGLPRGKHAHTTWLQLSTEIGIPGAGLLLLFYLVVIARLWPLARESYPAPDPWFRHTARMVIASVTGFVFTAQFVSLPGLEAPYYVALLGAGALKLLSAPGSDAHAAGGPGGESSDAWHPAA